MGGADVEGMEEVGREDKDAVLDEAGV